MTIDGEEVFNFNIMICLLSTETELLVFLRGY